jgi:CheY-like chemotaxis protein
MASRASILIVDDSRETREIYADYLTYFGYRVAGVGSAGEAFRALRTARADVIVIDLSLPGMDGYEATRRLRAEPNTKGVRIIMLTGHLLKGSERLALAAGADAFLTKPCLPEDLLKTIDGLLQRPDATATSA